MDHSCFRFRINAIWCCGQHPTARSSCYTREHIYCLYIVDIYIDAYILSAFFFTWNTLEKSIKISKNIETHTCSVKAACAMHVFPQNNLMAKCPKLLLPRRLWCLQPLNPPDITTRMATPPQHSMVVPGGWGTEPGISNQSASHVPAAPKGAGEGWEARSQLFAILEKETYFLSAPVWTINQRLNDL